MHKSINNSNEVYENLKKFFTKVQNLYLNYDFRDLRGTCVWLVEKGKKQGISTTNQKMVYWYLY